VEVEALRAIPLPRSAYYPKRRRYRADRILEFLRQRFEREAPEVRVLALTAVDISTTKGPHPDWGVFGLGDLGGRAAVISLFRLRRRVRSRAHFSFRVVTTALHEVGHTLGLDHCREPRCVMLDAEGSIASTDHSDGHLGRDCRARIERALSP
jgi:archaemetzincin